MNDSSIVIHKPVRKFMTIELIGDTPLIMHKMSEKSREMIRAKQQQKAKKVREARNPDQEYKDAMYTDGNGGYVFPARAFKAAAVEACRQADGITMASARQMFFVKGIKETEWVSIEPQKPIKPGPIQSKEWPIMREDVVTIGQGTTDLRYRPQFNNWKALIKVEFLKDVISPEQIVNIFELAGFCSGIGEDRPNKKGHTFGMFQVGNFEVN